MPVQLLVRAQPPPAQALTINVTLNADGCMLVRPSSETTVTIAGGDSEVTLTVSTTGVEAGAHGCTVTATIAPGDRYAVSDTEAMASVTRTGAGGTDSATDEQPVVTIVADSGSVAEGSLVRFTVTATPAPASPLEVNLSWTGSPLSGTPPATVTVSPAGTAAVETATADDAVADNDGVVSVTVGSGPGYTVGDPRTATVSVVDDDGGGTDQATRPPPVVTIVADSGSVTEGSRVRFTVTATPAPASPLEVNLSWTGSPLSGTPPATVTVSTAGTAAVETATADDAVADNDGVVSVTVGSGPGYTVGDPRTATVSVVDDDGGDTGQATRSPPVVTIVADSGSVTEGSLVRFTVTATPAPASPLEVNLSWAGSPLSGTPPATVTVSTAGTAAVETATADDAIADNDGVVSVTVGSGPGYTVGDPRTATVVVNDNDNDRRLTIDSLSPDPVPQGQTLTIRMAFTPPTMAKVTYRLRIVRITDRVPDESPLAIPVFLVRTSTPRNLTRTVAADTSTDSVTYSVGSVDTSELVGWQVFVRIEAADRGYMTGNKRSVAVTWQ